MAAAFAPEMMKTISTGITSMGASSGATVLSFTWMPTITIGKGKDKKEIPDPKFPAGIQVQLPGWFMMVAVVVGPVVAVVILLYILDVIKRFIQSKEKDLIVRLSRASTGWFSELENPFKQKGILAGLGI
jgi:hypothetical protein